MPSKGFVSISVPVSLISKIESIIQDDKKGYRNVAEFVREALRMRLSQLRSLYRLKTSIGTKGAPPKASTKPKEKSQQDPTSKDIPKRNTTRSSNAPITIRKKNGKSGKKNDSFCILQSAL